MKLLKLQMDSLIIFLLIIKKLILNHYPNLSTMKTILLLTCFVVLNMTSYGQQNHGSKTHSYEDYMRKSKNQKTVGRCLLAGGIIMTIVGVRMAYKEGLWGPEPAETDFILPLVGVGSIISSIPLFIISGDNKRKAASISVGFRSLSLTRQNSFISNTQPALTLRIGL